MGISAAERNRRKRERKKREREERRKLEEKEQGANEEESADKNETDDVEVEYVADPVVPEGMEGVMQRFLERSAVVTDDEKPSAPETAVSSRNDGGDDEDDDDLPPSKRKLREMIRPSVAELKRRVERPDLVEAHDVTALDPDFLIQLKAIPGSVPVPRHWGRKRKYLQGKRGFEKPPLQLPDFIVKTGITEIRDSLAEDEAGQSAKQRNRGRVAPKMGAMDVDYRTLHDAFFKYQSKPSNLTKLGDLYYEGKEMETQTNIKPGGPLSDGLREALGMTSETSPPPWLNNMQRYGPPPSYPTLKIPGLNSPLPTEHCQYGYHPGGWGKPPVDTYGRPLYGGNPFDPPGTVPHQESSQTALVTSDGKTVGKAKWGALPDVGYDEPTGPGDVESDSDGEEMEESSSEEEEEMEEATPDDGGESVLPPPPFTSNTAAAAPLDLRKQGGDETPAGSALEAPKQLYQVIPQAQATAQSGVVFASSVAYAVPGQLDAPDGAASVLSKAQPADAQSQKQNGKGDLDDDNADNLGKKFKF